MRQFAYIIFAYVIYLTSNIPFMETFFITTNDVSNVCFSIISYFECIYCDFAELGVTRYL